MLLSSHALRLHGSLYSLYLLAIRGAIPCFAGLEGIKRFSLVILAVLYKCAHTTANQGLANCRSWSGRSNNRGKLVVYA